MVGIRRGVWEKDNYAEAVRFARFGLIDMYASEAKRDNNIADLIESGKITALDQANSPEPTRATTQPAKK